MVEHGINLSKHKKAWLQKYSLLFKVIYRRDTSYEQHYNSNLSNTTNCSDKTTISSGYYFTVNYGRT